jgi:hypothetical protein
MPAYKKKKLIVSITDCYQKSYESGIHLNDQG